jgi:hypothetical protein
MVDWRPVAQLLTGLSVVAAHLFPYCFLLSLKPLRIIPH